MSAETVLKELAVEFERRASNRRAVASRINSGSRARSHEIDIAMQWDEAASLCWERATLKETQTPMASKRKPDFVLPAAASDQCFPRDIGPSLLGREEVPEEAVASAYAREPVSDPERVRKLNESSSAADIRRTLELGAPAIRKQEQAKVGDAIEQAERKGRNQERQRIQEALRGEADESRDMWDMTEATGPSDIAYRNGRADGLELAAELAALDPSAVRVDYSGAGQHVRLKRWGSHTPMSKQGAEVYEAMEKRWRNSNARVVEIGLIAEAVGLQWKGEPNALETGSVLAAVRRAVGETDHE